MATAKRKSGKQHDPATAKPGRRAKAISPLLDAENEATLAATGWGPMKLS